MNNELSEYSDTFMYTAFVHVVFLWISQLRHYTCNILGLDQCFMIGINHTVILENKTVKIQKFMYLANLNNSF